MPDLPTRPIDDFISIVQVRHQWSGDAWGAGESSWSLIVPRADSNPQATVWATWQLALPDYFVRGRGGNFRLDRILIEDRWPRERATVVEDVRLDGTEPGSGHGTAPQTTTVISWRTGAIGRRHRGRTYMGPYALESMHDSTVSSPALEATDDFAEQLYNAFVIGATSAGARFAIVSALPDDDESPFGTFTPVTSWRIIPRWGVVRRRSTEEWRS